LCERRSNKIDGLVIDEVALYLQVNEPRPWGVGLSHKKKKSQDCSWDFALQDGLGFKKMKSLETFGNCKKLKYR
jgi:hypothetical protein